MSEIKICPVCGSKPDVNNELSTRILVSCSNISCWLYCIGFHLEDWNESRPIEDQLKADNERLQARVQTLEHELEELNEPDCEWVRSENPNWYWKTACGDWFDDRDNIYCSCGKRIKYVKSEE